MGGAGKGVFGVASVPVVVGRSFLRYPPHLVKGAVRAPRVGVEAGRPGHRQDVPMRAEVGGVSIFRRLAPAAAVITLNCRGLHRRLHLGLNGFGPGDWSSRIVEHITGLTSAKRNDAADRVVRRNPDGDPVSGHDLDAKSPHPAAKLSEHLMSGVALNAIKPSAVHRNHRSLHVDQIVFAQTGSKSFPCRHAAGLLFKTRPTCTAAGNDCATKGGQVCRFRTAASTCVAIST